MIQAQESMVIGCTPCPRCALCGGVGTFIYREQRDRLFGAEGEWHLKRCSTTDCGLLWLDPMPMAGEIGKAYASYYTHGAGQESSYSAVLKKLYRQAKRGYIVHRYGYSSNIPSWTRALGCALYLFPARRSDVDQEVRFLPSKANGRLLDVGCGAGQWLARMRDLGWDAEGLDFDARAVEVARQNGLTVGCGALEEQGYASNSFDAVTLNHVIEHVPDPKATVIECLRILKPGGKLVIATPNSASLSHRLFGQHWRGLEPPRHLHIFSVDLLARMLMATGFKGLIVHPHVAESVIRESLDLATLRSARLLRCGLARRFMVALMTTLESLVLGFKPGWGDCVVVVAIK